MANPCAGLDPTWPHLTAPTPTAGHCHLSSTSSWLFPTAAFENEALTCALRASMSSPANANASASASAAASSTSYPTTPSSSSTSSASELLSGGHDAPAARTTVLPPARAARMTGPKAGRVTKQRKPRPSRRPPPTYIVADPANFRRMVQEVTGFPVASIGVRFHQTTATVASEEPTSAAATSWPTTPPTCALPTLDTSAFLVDRAVPATPVRGPGDKTSSGGASPSLVVTAAVEDDDESSVLQELEAMASDFPTFESWGII